MENVGIHTYVIDGSLVGDQPTTYCTLNEEITVDENTPRKYKSSNANFAGM